MYVIENKDLKIAVKEKGSELCSIFDKKSNREYMWQAGEEWNKNGPVLFPAIGGFKDGKYLVNGREYTMPPHGFARDMPFQLLEKSGDKIVMLLKSNDKTKAMYPFDFALKITHRIEGRRLFVTWTVQNIGNIDMYFSIGAHPGFRILEGTNLSDYRLIFDKKVDLVTNRVKGRLVTSEKYPIAENTGCLKLSKSLLEQDAVIFEAGLEGVTLENQQESYKLRMDFPQFPVVAFWSSPDYLDNARFLCIEPWFGLNDTVDQEVKELSEKYLIQKLGPSEVWEKGFFITLFD